MKKFGIRRADIGDIELIRSLAKAAFPAAYAEILTPEQTAYMMEWMYSAKSIEKQLEKGHAYFIADFGGKPCGYVSVERQDAALFHLQKIYVLPEIQGKGLGKFMFEAAKNHIKSVCPQRCVMELNVNRKNPAVGFYERMGMSKSRSGDFEIGEGFFMNDFIMSMEL